jgi:WD40 repeat protein
VVDLERGEEVAAFEHADNILGADFSADNRLLAVASKDSTVQIWDLETGEPVRRFWSGSDQALMFVNFVENDTHILFAESKGDGIIRRAPVSIDALIDDVCSRALRDLTPEERDRYNLDDAPTCPKFAEP